MANLNPSHDIVNKPGDEGHTEGMDPQAEEHNTAVSYPSHDVVQKPGQEGSSGLSQNDTGYQQGYVCSAVDHPAPNYVGPGGPKVDQTHVPAANASNPTPEMPGA